MKWAQKQTGFTIVELLIVVVVIAILAAITIVGFNGVSNSAKESAFASDIANIERFLELEKVKTNTDTYPAPGATNLQASTGINASFLLATPNIYCIDVTKNGETYGAARDMKPAPGACAVNLVKNPKGVGPASSYASSGWFYPLGTTTDEVNVNWGGRSDWHRFVWTGTGFGTKRMLVDLTDLTNAQIYTASILVGNPGTASASFQLDFVDTGAQTFTLAPGESRRVSISTSRSSYDNVFRFIDIELGPVNATGLLFTDAMLTRTTTQTGYGDGSSPGWAWTGAVNGSKSTGPAKL